MKMSEAMAIIGGKKLGFLITFDWAGDGFLRSDHFPDLHSGENPIETKQAAWELAKLFASKLPRRAVNIYVVDQDFKPVDNYKEKEIKNR